MNEKVQTEQTETEDTESKPITQKELHAAMTAREKRMLSTIEKLLADKLSNAVAPIQEKLATPAEPKSEIDAKFEMMQKKIEAAERRYDEERKAREEERKARMRDEERVALADALRSGGLDDKRLRGAAALLYSEERRVVRDPETGSIKFRQEKDGYEELVDLGKGIAEWLKTEDGKAYLPPRQTAGSGASAVGGRPRNGGVSKVEQAKELLMELVASERD